MNEIVNIFRRIIDRVSHIWDTEAEAINSKYGNIAHTVSGAARHLYAGDAAAHHAIVKYQQSIAELGMHSLKPLDTTPISGLNNLVYIGRSDRGYRSVYKPAYLEHMIEFQGEPVRYGLPRGGGGLGKREVAAFRINQLLGFSLVPPTAIVEGPYGPGALQLWVHSSPSHPQAARLRLQGELHRRLSPNEINELTRLNSKYPIEQREMMAVLDYVIANTDRHLLNYRTGRNGNIVAIDHSYSFPDTPDSRFGVRSDFTFEFQGVKLNDDVLSLVRKVEPNELSAALKDLDLSDRAIDGTLSRFAEISAHGMITGGAWPGEIRPGILRGVPTQWIPSGWLDS